MSHFGMMQIHRNAQIGFHGSLLNRASLQENKGLIGFYGDLNNKITGTTDLLVYDAEIANISGIELEVNILIKNHLNYIEGDFIPAKSKKGIGTIFLSGSFWSGASDFSKTDGLATAMNTNKFNFPVGDVNQYRPLFFSSHESAAVINCSYSRNDYNLLNNFEIWGIAQNPKEFYTLSTREYWKLSGNKEGSIILYWNANSGISEIAENIDKVEIIGLHRLTNQWLSLGLIEREGNLWEGHIKTNYFIPDDFEILTFGSRKPQKPKAFPNYFISPNNDGINDILRFENLDSSSRYSLKIYDRRGILVFESPDYHDEFMGISNIKNGIIERNLGLPRGVYYYILQQTDSPKTIQGFLYLNR
jgi:gliding motility-associated-like protein